MQEGGHTIVPDAVWKKVYVTYIQNFPHNILQEDTLKDRLRDALKEIQTGNSNDASGKTCLQSDVVLEQLRQTYDHASMNTLKIMQSLEGPPI